MITNGFHHITLIASEAERSARFYRDILGIDLIAAGVGSDGTSPVMYFGRNGGEPGTLLRVVEARGIARGRPGSGGVHHFALTVDTADAQLMWKRRLQDHGVQVSGPYNRGWFRSIYFTDPDGQIVEIATRGPGYTVDEPADALGTAIVIPPGAELRGARDEAMVHARTHAKPVPEITREMQLDGLHHISGMTDDVEQVGEFYEAALGLRPVKRSVNQDDPSMPHWFWATYDGREVAPHSSLTMFGYRGSTGGAAPGRLKRAVSGIGQTHSVAFRAADDEQLRSWQERIRTLGTEASDVIDRTWYRTFEFRAPDGMLMEVSTDAPGFALEEAA